MRIREYLKRAWRRTYHRRTVGRAAASTAAVVVLVLVGLGWAGKAIAAPSFTGCQTEVWWVLGSTQRTLCDGPIRFDGSWLRYREFWTPAHNVPLSCSTYGGSSFSTTSCTGGYWQPRTSKGIETYIVTPDTVLADEPGHLVDGVST